ncbi:hypothetical protein TorRG33x02_284280 [Trema orientale]|uniref:Uncharacterized protein n=1 Tax=Trema orientale TaxID=63057 RepID=A0A2P5CHW7_TREOI|nr:hypothetical protein TorRG33x02_284280 [Trema orientale]
MDPVAPVGLQVALNMHSRPLESIVKELMRQQWDLVSTDYTVGRVRLTFGCRLPNCGARRILEIMAPAPHTNGDMEYIPPTPRPRVLTRSPVDPRLGIQLLPGPGPESPRHVLEPLEILRDGIGNHFWNELNTESFVRMKLGCDVADCNAVRSVDIFSPIPHSGPSHILEFDLDDDVHPHVDVDDHIDPHVNVDDYIDHRV